MSMLSAKRFLNQRSTLAKNGRFLFWAFWVVYFLEMIATACYFYPVPVLVYAAVMLIPPFVLWVPTVLFGDVIKDYDGKDDWTYKPATHRQLVLNGYILLSVHGIICLVLAALIAGAFTVL